MHLTEVGRWNFSLTRYDIMVPVKRTSTLQEE